MAILTDDMKRLVDEQKLTSSRDRLPRRIAEPRAVRATARTSRP